MKIGISAAETSGDLLGAKLIESLKKQNSDIGIEGLAGEKMVASGCQQLWDQKLVNVMGFTEVVTTKKKYNCTFFCSKTSCVYWGRCAGF